MYIDSNTVISRISCNSVQLNADSNNEVWRRFSDSTYMYSRGVEIGWYTFVCIILSVYMMSNNNVGFGFGMLVYGLILCFINLALHTVSGMRLLIAVLRSSFVAITLYTLSIII